MQIYRLVLHLDPKGNAINLILIYFENKQHKGHNEKNVY
jgi:hypothetical protein